MTLWRTSFVAAAIVGIAVPALAQRGMGGGPNYNPATETTLNATVTEVQTIPSGGRGGGGLHLIVSADGATYDVHVGPASFVSSKEFMFEKSDALTIVGSKVTVDDKPVVIAREITKDGKTLALRDGKGFPLWRGGRTYSASW